MTDPIIDPDDSGVVLFFGSMNAMPMMYAERLREQGHDVRYFVDAPKQDFLSRPESQLPSLYPYPDWIVEFPIRWQILVSLFPRIFLWMMLRSAKKKKRFDRVKAVFMGGFFINYSTRFCGPTSRIFLTFGADFDAWCDIDKIDEMFDGMRNESLFKFFPRPIAYRLLNRIVRRNWEAAINSDVVIYFPRGMNTAGDRLLDRMESLGVTYIPRYDVSFEALKEASREFKNDGGPLRILSPVRFTYFNISEGNDEYSKGNDKIIQGIALYYKRNPNIEVHFFEKGADVVFAKQLCDELEISHVVRWHRPVPLSHLIEHYEKCDVCFDQIGEHFMGHVGMYSLYLGKPLITNTNNLGFLEQSPILHASSAQEVAARLTDLEDIQLRHSLHRRSIAYAETAFTPTAVLSRLTRRPGEAA